MDWIVAVAVAVAVVVVAVVCCCGCCCCYCLLLFLVTTTTAAVGKLDWIGRQFRKAVVRTFFAMAKVKAMAAFLNSVAVAVAVVVVAVVVGCCCCCCSCSNNQRAVAVGATNGQLLFDQCSGETVIVNNSNQSKWKLTMICC